MEKYFSKKFISSQSGLIYLIIGKDTNQDAWYYVLFKNKIKYIMFEKIINNNKSSNKSIKINEYGEILFSGGGKHPPFHITSSLKKKYLIKHNE